MTRPRRVLPDTTSLLTRRCSERRLLLQPEPTVNAIFEYLLAVYSESYGLLVHAYVCLGNHYHIVATDTRGLLPKFAQDFNALLARAVNAERERCDHFWDAREASYVTLLEPADVLDKIVYTICNPVSSGLVEDSSSWKGARSRPSDYAIGARTVSRPDGARFFGRQSKLPEVARLALMKPRGFEDLSDADFAKLVAERVREHEARLRAEAAAELQGFLGADAVRRRSPLEAPKSPPRRHGLRPLVACRDRKKRIAFLEDFRRFLACYSEALGEFRQGLRDTVFPSGTWWMAVVIGAKCAQAP